MAPAAPAAAHVRLAITASVAGELTTCGCRSGPQGGLARRSARLDSLRAETPDLVLLDAGGYASLDPVAGGVITDSLAAYMWREGYHAVAIGDEEIAAGVALGPVDAHPPYVSANLFLERGDRLEPLVSRFVLLDAGGVRVGVTSVVSAALVEAHARDALRVLDAEEAARDVLAEMRAAGSGLQVLLAHTGEVEAERLARAVDGYDVVVVGHQSRARREHRVRDGTVLVHPGTRGRYLSDVGLELDAHGLAFVRGHTEGIERTDPVDLEVQRWAQASLAEADAARRRAMIRNAGGDGRAPGGSARDADEVGEGSDAGAGAAPAGCVACHRQETASWLRTPHARALETLAAVEMHREGICLTCHVTSVAEGPMEERTGTGGGVGCVACHAVPAGHPQGPPVPRVEPSSCRRCHDAENSPDYAPEAYWRAILHDAPAEPAERSRR